MTPFSQRAQDMGLNIQHAYKGMYSYQDRFSEVVYRQMSTRTSPGNPIAKENETDDLDLPYLAVFTRHSDQLNYNYAGYVSNLYKFVGNDVLCAPIVESIASTGSAILRENSIFSGDYAKLRHEMIIQSSVSSPIAGDILPIVMVANSYNGTRRASLAFGLATAHDRMDYVTFAFQLGEISMIHIESSDTNMTTAVSDYVETFRASINEMVSQSFERQLTEEDMFATLDLIEGLGKRRREIISEDLPETVTAWGMFLAIVRYSSFESNLNMKRMLENIAESVLVIPGRMYEVLNRLQNQQ